MRKSDLVLLKRSFDNQKRYSQYVGGDGSLYENLTENQILSMTDSDLAVNTVTTVMREMILYLSNSDVSYNGIAVCPLFSVFVDNDFIDEKGNIANKKGILDDYVGISFDKAFVYSGRTHSEVFPITSIDDAQYILYGKFSDFVLGLNECGLDLEGITSFNDIRELIYEDKRPFGKVAVSFKKTRPYTKK